MLLLLMLLRHASRAATPSNGVTRYVNDMRLLLCFVLLRSSPPRPRNPLSIPPQYSTENVCFNTHRQHHHHYHRHYHYPPQQPHPLTTTGITNNSNTQIHSNATETLTCFYPL